MGLPPWKQGSWANMGATWVLSAPGGPHLGHVNLTIWGITVLPVYVTHLVEQTRHWSTKWYAVYSQSDRSEYSTKVKETAINKNLMNTLVQAQCILILWKTEVSTLPLLSKPTIDLNAQVNHVYKIMPLISMKQDGDQAASV